MSAKYASLFRPLSAAGGFALTKDAMSFPFSDVRIGSNLHKKFLVAGRGNAVCKPERDMGT